MNKTVFDPLRKKSVALTPEEEVRQFFIAWLSRERNWPLALMASEYGLKFNGRSYRCDIVAFNRELQPQIIVECKAPGVKLGQQVVDQVITYNRILNVPYIVITNGGTTYICSLNKETGKYEYVADLPHYPNI